jgi:DNA-binding transcriptional regulator YiaG
MLKKSRLRLASSKSTLAKRLSVCLGTLHNWESGLRTLTRRFWPRIAALSTSD